MRSGVIIGKSTQFAEILHQQPDLFLLLLKQAQLHIRVRLSCIKRGATGVNPLNSSYDGPYINLIVFF